MQSLFSFEFQRYRDIRIGVNLLKSSMQTSASTPSTLTGMVLDLENEVTGSEIAEIDLMLEDGDATKADPADAGSCSDGGPAITQST
ncbi:hypothetical protein [Methylobacterium iners]|uniref:Uncharacterized protein n=1 Tax=Methylobacterium iners TaxID=418707 RepID=A0ABQ4RU98_9HYPH|nr:hypothetical protein [Methylobacterium iners]GJD93940.1 hypothetical protein OCOJLMKI_1138 [Methylobacterium iners]